MNFLSLSSYEWLLAGLWAVFSCGLSLSLARVALDMPAASTTTSAIPRIAHRLPFFLRALMPLTTRPAIYFHRPIFKNITTRLERRITTAGYEDTLTAQEYLALCALTPLTWGLGLALAALGLFAAGGDPMGTRPIALATALFIWMTIYPRTWLISSVTRRHREILRALPFVIDLLTISVEAGLDFMTAIRNIIERRQPDALGEELGRVLFEIQLGKTRREALRHMAARVNQIDMHSLIAALTQADEMGVSIGATLRVQSDQIRAKRFLRAEKLAHEAPVKMLFPLIAFIFPAVFLVLLGPLILQILSQGM